MTYASTAPNTLNQPLAPQPIALALSGGGGRSFLQVGALQALEDAGFTVAAVTGCSSGAILGAYLAAGHTARELERALAGGDVAHWLGVKFGRGLVGQTGLEEWLRGNVPETFEELQLPLGIVATDIQSGEEVVFRTGVQHGGPLHGPVLASSAFTGAIYPRRVAGRWLSDGGLVNELPADLARDLSAELGGLPVVALDVTSPLKALDFDPPQTVRERLRELASGKTPWIPEVLRQAFVITQNHVTTGRINACPPDWLVPFKGARELDVFDLQEVDLARGVQLGYGIMQQFLEAAQRGEQPTHDDQLGGRVFARADG